MHSRIRSDRPQFDLTRYEHVRSLGVGGVGTVDLVVDRETGERLALKKLQRLDQKSILRFKREFRALSDLHHPNLIRFYDFGRGRDAWFLSMEYVEGRSLSEELRGDVRVTDTRDDRVVSANDQLIDPAFFARLAGIFHQLALGVRAVHQAGMLHRDLKPSNVLVASSGRVVLLDFGLVRQLELDGDAAHLTHEGTIAGTPAYMSPEQASAQPLTEASDWYSFGAMLYEALSGKLPIEGRNATILLQRKLSTAPEPLVDEADGPLPLRELCMALLQQDPGARPRGEDVIAALAELSPAPVLREHTRTEELAPLTEAVSTAPLIGRDRELAQLLNALPIMESRQTLVAHVRGSSGAGKTALVERFLVASGLLGDSRSLVLRSRCYEREAMPFKALDGVMDALVEDLFERDDIEVAYLLPPGIADLAQLFPVFERLPAMQQLMSDKKAIGDAAEIRRRAENALRELTRRVATQRRLVIWIDDLHWGDLDSARILKNWLSRGADGPVLLILSYRIDEVESSPCLSFLLQPNETASASEVVVDVNPLLDAEVRALCAVRLETRTPLPPPLIDRVVTEARGNPFLAQQLVDLAIARPADSAADLDSLSVEQLVLRTRDLLPQETRELLNVLAIAGRPLAPQLALAATEIYRDGRSHIHALQALRLVRTRVVGGQRLLDVYHDRVREGIQAGFRTSERELRCARLLRVLEITKVADPDWLHELALGANERPSALRYGLLAAERASATLAFERAAELYEQCLRIEDSAALRVKLAVALTRCSRGVAAAAAYLEAAKTIQLVQQPLLLRRAAAHLVRSGRFEEGERVVQQTLDLLGLDVPATQLGLMAAIGWERARIAVRGYALRNDKAPEESARLSRAAELYGTLSVETQLYEPVRSALFQARSLRLALESGNTEVVGRALCLTSAIVCLSGTERAERRASELIDRAEELSRQTDSDHLKVEVPTSRALCATFLGRPLEVLEHSAAAERAYAVRNPDESDGDYYYTFGVSAVRLSALSALGRHADAREELREYLARAQTTDNRAAILQVTLSRTIAERALSNCAGSRERLDTERAQLPNGSFGVLHLVHLIATLQVACATGAHDWAFQRLDQDWPTYLAAPLHDTAYTACVAHYAHARLLLNHHVASGAKGDVAGVLRPDLRVITKLPPTALRDGVLSRLRARSTYLNGDTHTAIELLRKSAKALDEACCLDEPERDRFAIGCLLGGTEGAQLCAAADAKLRELGVSDPVEELRGFYPELFVAGLVKMAR